MNLGGMMRRGSRKNPFKFGSESGTFNECVQIVVDSNKNPEFKCGLLGHYSCAAGFVNLMKTSDE